MELTNEMKQAVDNILEDRTPLFITGKAGTGKTTLLHYIVSTVRENVVVAAPTGVAAVNAKGSTLHSLFNIPFGVLDPTAPVKLSKFTNKVGVMNAMRVLIIDEVSMVRPDVMDYIDAVLRGYRKNSMPFGGVKVVMIGDLYQLPPVVTAQEKDIISLWYTNHYFFNARVFNKTDIKVIELSRIFRQSEPTFIQLLNNIRTYNVGPDDLDMLSELRNKECKNSFNGQYIHICTHKIDVSRINTELLGKPTHTFKAKVTDKFNVNSAPCDLELKIRVGARVMILINDKTQGICNGSLGNIKEIKDDAVIVTLDNGKDVNISMNTWEDVEYKMTQGKLTSTSKGTISQFPITLAWAITIHKSQGLTFDHVIIHTKGAFCPGQIYVALSRCRTLEGIYIDSFISQRHIIPDSSLINFEQAYKSNNNIYSKKQHESTKC